MPKRDYTLDSNKRLANSYLYWSLCCFLHKNISRLTPLVCEVEAAWSVEDKGVGCSVNQQQEVTDRHDNVKVRRVTNQLLDDGGQGLTERQGERRAAILNSLLKHCITDN